MQDSWQGLREKGLQNSEGIRYNHFMSLLREDASVAAAAVAVPAFDAPGVDIPEKAQARKVVISLDLAQTLQARRTAIIQRETLLQRWAVALDISAARNAMLEETLGSQEKSWNAMQGEEAAARDAESKKLRAELDTREHDLARRAKVLEKEKAKLQTMLEDLRERAAVVQSAELNTERSQAQYSHDLSIRDEEAREREQRSLLREQELLQMTKHQELELGMRTEEASKALHAAQSEQERVKQQAEALRDREKKLEAMEAKQVEEVGGHTKALKEHEAKLHRETKKVLQKEKDVKALSVSLAAREEQIKSTERQLAQETEKRREAASELQTQLHAVKLESSMLDQGKEAVQRLEQKQAECMEREAVLASREKLVSAREGALKDLEKAKRKHEKHASESERSLAMARAEVESLQGRVEAEAEKLEMETRRRVQGSQGDSERLTKWEKQLEEREKEIREKERELQLAEDHAVQIKREAESALKKHKKSAKNESLEQEKERLRLQEMNVQLNFAQQDLQSQMEAVAVRERQLRSEHDEISIQKTALDGDLSGIGELHQKLAEAEAKASEAQEANQQERGRLDTELQTARNEAKASREWLRGQQQLMSEQLDAVLKAREDAKAEARLNEELSGSWSRLSMATGGSLGMDSLLSGLSPTSQQASPYASLGVESGESDLSDLGVKEMPLGSIEKPKLRSIGAVSRLSSKIAKSPLGRSPSRPREKSSSKGVSFLPRS
ncbi:hypothetical protein CYMTET_27050 [Cymbomonas tetramitiformis]|uniref:Uncharacterized protein n=1 Tax=Cymbomonas tetramitiformis TaxID=36881 RepID=A0AAE0KXA9_9CHLO|nr:hypothetical protein CYMTET_27050 [Cymbomonas tetramitiformis]